MRGNFIDFANSYKIKLNSKAIHGIHIIFYKLSLLLFELQIRHILENGSLYFPKFDTTAFRQDVHWTVYKCVASNTGGTIISRDLSIKAGKIEIQLRNLFISLLLYKSCFCIPASLGRFNSPFCT